MVKDLNGYVQLKSEWIMRTEEGFHKYAFTSPPLLKPMMWYILSNVEIIL